LVVWFDKTKDKRCSNCFLEYYCRGCPIAPFLLEDQMKIPHETCKPFKKCIKDSILIKIKEDLLDSNHWSNESLEVIVWTNILKDS
jgi:sulfatase maturation enzyme AslB (radical SAM superfamily)